MENFFLLFGGLTFGFGLYLNYEKNKIHSQKITPKVAKQFISCGAKVLDVRTPIERQVGSYTNSIHIPVSEISEQKLLENGINKDTVIVTYCNSGTRARNAAIKLANMGYINVYYIVETYKSL